MKELLHLQMFGNPNTNKTTDTTATTGNDLSPTMKVFYKTPLLENARQENYFNQFGKKTSLPKGEGNTVEWRRFKTFKRAMTPLEEGVTPDGNKVDMVKIQKQIDQYGDYTTLSDRLQLEAVDPIIASVTEEHGAQAGETLDTVTRNEVLKGTHVIYAGSKTSRKDITASDTITATLVNQVFTHLKKMKAPKINGDYIMIINPSVSYDLRESNGWEDVHKYAQPTEIFNGEIGKLHGIRFIESTNSKIFKGEKLAEDSADGNLAVNGAVAATDKGVVTFDGGTVEASALVGRFVLIDNVRYYVAANTPTTMTLKNGADKTSEVTPVITDDTVIYPGEAGKQNVAVYGNIAFGKDAYGVIEPSAESMEVIVKALGSGGTQDPLNQRSTIGWKASHAATILYQERLVRVETGSYYSDKDEEN